MKFVHGNLYKIYIIERGICGLLFARVNRICQNVR